MEFFDDAVNKTKEVFDVVSKKTGEVINTGKIKYEITSVKAKMQKDFEKLGKMYYSLLKQSKKVPESAEALLRDISEKEMRIETLNAALNELKNCVVCPKCGAPQEKSAVYCNVCGEKIDNL